MKRILLALALASLAPVAIAGVSPSGVVPTASVTLQQVMNQQPVYLTTQQAGSLFDSVVAHGEGAQIGPFTASIVLDLGGGQLVLMTVNKASGEVTFAAR